MTKALIKNNGLEQLLGKLDKLKSTGKNRWIACCPAHMDESPSLSITQVDDGRILIHCFAECQTSDVLNALNMTFEDLFPQSLGNFKRIAKPYYPHDILLIIACEARLVALAACDISKGKVMNDSEKERILLAAGRINKGLGMTNV